jgi:hypothetical protein
MYILGLTGRATDLWKQEINTEWRILVVQVALELSDLLAEHVWGVTDTTDNTEAAGIGNGCCELWASSNVHTSQEDWVLDLQEIGSSGADLLCGKALLAIVREGFSNAVPERLCRCHAGCHLGLLKVYDLRADILTVICYIQRVSMVRRKDRR